MALVGAPGGTPGKQLLVVFVEYLYGGLWGASGSTQGGIHEGTSFGHLWGT